jgi:NADH-quinone oxidoreductase subunit K
MNGLSSEVLVLATAAVLLAIGATGALIRRNPIAMLMSVELMLNAANLLLVLGARVRGTVDGQAAALIVLVLAAAEAVIGLGVALALFRDRDRVDVDEPAEVRG